MLLLYLQGSSLNHMSWEERRKFSSQGCYYCEVTEAAWTHRKVQYQILVLLCAVWPGSLMLPLVPHFLLCKMEHLGHLRACCTEDMRCWGLNLDFTLVEIPITSQLSSQLIFLNFSCVYNLCYVLKVQLLLSYPQLYGRAWMGHFGKVMMLCCHC